MTYRAWDDPEADGSTPLDEDAKAGLMLSWVTTRGDLIAAESANIAAGTPQRIPGAEEILDEQYLRDLHRALFGDVWSWAGRTRTVGVNIGGVDPGGIGPALRDLVADVAVWIESQTHDVDGILARFHHRLVWIHPFPNGNGRFSRVATDLLAGALGAAPFTWGIGLQLETPALRQLYRSALQQADRDFDAVDDLIAFARS